MEGLEVAVEEAREWMTGMEAPRVIDCREADEWEICRLENAELLPLSEFAQRYKEVLGNPEEAALIYCHHGVRSLHVAQWLTAQGYSRVRSLAGGIDAWAHLIEPGMSRY